MISYASEMIISCAKKKLSICWKWLFLNDLLSQKMISGCFLLQKKKWITAVKNHLLPVQKWLIAQENDFEGTQKWFSWNDFWDICCRFWRLDLLLGKKNISFGNGHFQKWVEIIFFMKMLHKLPKTTKILTFSICFQIEWAQWTLCAS